MFEIFAKLSRLRYPPVIVPIEFKTATAANARRWWIRDEELLANHENKYVAYAKVRFDNSGCVG